MYRERTLYRRRQVRRQKMIIATVLTIFIMVCSMFFRSILTDAHGNRSEDPVDYKYYTSIQVEAGDTLSSIAKEYRTASDESTDDYIDQLKEMNHLSSDEIHEGEYLMVAYADTELK